MFKYLRIYEYKYAYKYLNICTCKLELFAKCLYEAEIWIYSYIMINVSSFFSLNSEIQIHTADFWKVIFLLFVHQLIIC